LLGGSEFTRLPNRVFDQAGNAARPSRIQLSAVIYTIHGLGVNSVPEIYWRNNHFPASILVLFP